MKARPKVRLRETPWTPEFMAEYEAAKGRIRADNEGNLFGNMALVVHALLR